MSMTSKGLALSACVVAACVAGLGESSAAAIEKPWRVISEQTASGFEFPESVAYDPKAKVLYVGQFGGAKLAPGEKDGQGRISKVSLDGKIIENRFLPASSEVMHKPKGIWVDGNRLWVTDIDAVWIFDLKSRKGRKLEIPGMVFANDPAVVGNSLYVSDNRADRLYRIEPADFLDAKVNPQVSIPVAGRSINPNGIYPGKHHSVLMAGFMSPKEPRGIWSLSRDGDLKEVAKPIGQLDGLYQMKDGSLLVTNWVSGSLFHWSERGGMVELAKGFKGPADFTVITKGKGITVVVPDLVASQLRIVQLGK